MSLKEAAPNEVKGEIIKSDLSAAGVFFAKVELSKRKTSWNLVKSLEATVCKVSEKSL